VAAIRKTLDPDDDITESQPQDSRVTGSEAPGATQEPADFTRPHGIEGGDIAWGRVQVVNLHLNYLQKFLLRVSCFDSTVSEGVSECVE